MATTRPRSTTPRYWCCAVTRCARRTSGCSVLSRPRSSVAYRQRELAEVARTVEPLAESERARTALLNAVSHDLRTPIAAAKAAVSSLLGGDVAWSDEDRHELLASADMSLDRLTDLVTNLLDLSRLQAGVLPVLAGPVGLEDIVSRALDHAAPPGVHLDDRRAGRPARGRCRRRAARASDRQPGAERIAVRTGGITCPDQRQRSRRVRRVTHCRPRPGHCARGRRRRLRCVPASRRLAQVWCWGGLGLGLAIARGFAEAMGGSVLAEETPGGGATLVVRLAAVGYPR